MIIACAKIKDEITRRDFKDVGERKKLNFGHTFGHAIESFSLSHGGQSLSHGEAVGIGMACAMCLSVKKTGLPQSIFDEYVKKVRDLLGKQHFATEMADTILYYMYADKKNADGEIRCVLLKDIGEAVWDIAVTKDEILEAILSI